MLEPELSMTRGSLYPRVRRLSWCASGFFLLWLPLAAVGETYLDAIQTEAEKLGSIPEKSNDTGSVEGDPRAAFESELEQRYRGSYLFYKKLPVESQEEVYLEYEGGSPIEEVRKTIMNRFLHSR